MYNNIGDQDAQIKALPEGDMKNSLLETFLKTMNAGQRQKGHETSNREGIRPLF